MYALRKSICIPLIVLLVAVAAWLGCRSAPITQRRQLLLIPEDYETSLGVSSYQEILSSETASTNSEYIEMVNRVGQRIAHVANRPDYQWEFRVIASDKQNAFCLPGGKVAIYEGILPVCASEAGLAVVMSHEVAHALARHGGERMSQGIVADAAGNVLRYVSQGQAAHDQKILMGAYGAASKYGVILPFSRKHESEADHMGLLLMAQAGYDPSVAPLFWERFAASKPDGAPPEFLSTHPADARRSMELRQLLPEAMTLYEQAPVKYGIGERINFASSPSSSTAAR